MKIHYEKFQNLPKDIIGLPSLIVKVILGVLLLVLLGYIFLTGDISQDRNDGAESENIEVEDDTMVSEDENGAPQLPASSEELIESETNIISGDIKISSNKDLTIFEIWNGETKAGEIEREGPSQVAVWKEIGGSVYLGVNNDGLGGYILFGGPDEVYKLDTKKGSLTRALTKIFDRDMFASDISADEKHLASVETFFMGEEIHNYINVYNLADYKSESYQVPVKYRVAGNAFFSRDGKKVVYEAAVSDPENEEFAMFVIDLTTGKQTQIGGTDVYGKAEEWAKDN
ncbi:MAG: hypothetical protein WC180_03405 [Candidatus Paceibacterota bacterium]|jgi:hypothetical protein